VDARGIEHTIRVSAQSLYEMVANEEIKSTTGSARSDAHGE
jgi:hypothetical protein